MAASDPVQGTRAQQQHVWSTPGAPGALIPTHMVCGAMGDVPHQPVLAQVPAGCLPTLAQQQTWVAVPKILETAALQCFWCPAP